MRVSSILWNNAGAILRRRRGFTLTELMVVMLIIALLVALGAGAYFRSMQRSDITTTKAVIQELHTALQERLSQFDRQTIDSAGLMALAHPTGGTAPERSAVGKRAAVLARLAALRACFPQQFIDFMRPADEDPSDNTVVGLVATGFDPGPARAAIYQEYLSGTGQVTSSTPFNPATTYSTVPTNHQILTESSECLYLILSVETPGSSFRVDQIPDRFRRDTDGDGLPEFLDAWGNPLQFYRWPTDYMAYLLDVTHQLPATLQPSLRQELAQHEATTGTPYQPGKADRLSLFANEFGTRISTLDPDGLLTESSWFLTSSSTQRTANFEQAGFFRLHQAFPQPIPDPIPMDLNSTDLDATGACTARRDDFRAYPLLPLIVSAGPDGELGLMVIDGDGDGLPDRAPHANEMHLRGARIDTERLPMLADNILNLELQEGTDQ